MGLKLKLWKKFNLRLKEFYKRLLGSSSMNFSGHSLLFEIMKSITAEDCTLLAAPVTLEEIKRAMFSIPGNKAPYHDQ